MTKDKIVLLVMPSDQGDILTDYVEWHLHLGIDLILAEDVDSSDNTHEILASFSKTGRLHWSLIPERNRLKYRAEEALVNLAIEQHGADWIIMSDVDEFLCSPRDDLRAVLQRAAADDVTAISVPCFNMIGPALQTDRRATETQTLRIDRPRDPPAEQLIAGHLPVPYVFIRHPPKTVARAAAFAKYGPGMHSVGTVWGKTRRCGELRFLHYPIRGFDKLEVKASKAADFFDKNTHLEPWWCWHWRRWIRLNQAGLLREEYESQFLSPDRARELVRDGTCTVDETVADWIRESTVSRDSVQDR
jgi:hypothetical protein